MRKEIKDHRIVMAAMVCITVLEIVALLKGINGVLLTTVVGLIAGLTGWMVKTPKLK